MSVHRLSVKSEGEAYGAKIFLDDMEITSCVHLEIDANSGALPMATMKLYVLPDVDSLTHVKFLRELLSESG